MGQRWGKEEREDPDVLTGNERLRGLTRSPGGWQCRVSLLRIVISVGYSSHLPLLTS